MPVNPIHRWWGPPKNFSDRVNERKVSWLELFYDLVYVAAIGQLTHHMAHHLDWHTVGYTFLLFSLVFWSWVNGSQYYDLHGSDGLRTRYFTLLQMLGVAAVAITINDTYEGHHTGFAITFAIVETIINYLWWSTGIWDPSHRQFSVYYTVNYTLATLLLVVSAFTDYQTATLLWWAVLLLNLTPGLVGAKTIINGLKKRGEVFSASETLIERFGLFTIIVLAESILAIVNGIAEVQHRTPTDWLAFIFGIIITFLLWSIYFDMTSEQETKKGYAYLQYLIFLHFPLLASFGVIGAGIKLVLEGQKQAEEQQMLLWIFCVALAVVLVCVVGITTIMEEQVEDRAYIKPTSRLLLVIAALVLALPLLGWTTLTPALFLGIITLLLFVPVFVGVRSWVKFKFFGGQA